VCFDPRSVETLDNQRNHAQSQPPSPYIQSPENLSTWSSWRKSRTSPSRQSRLDHPTTKTTTTLILVCSLTRKEVSSFADYCLDSEISTDDEDNVPEEETLADRLLALRDIIPPTTRSYIANKVDATTSWVKSGLVFSGKTLWVVSTSALLLGVPWALAFAEEQQMVEMEKEMRAREMGGEVRQYKQGSIKGLPLLSNYANTENQLLNPGNTAGALNAQLGAQQAKPAL
jgi:import receptor subunit TOM22